MSDKEITRKQAFFALLSLVGSIAFCVYLAFKLKFFLYLFAFLGIALPLTFLAGWCFIQNMGLSYIKIQNFWHRSYE